MLDDFSVKCRDLLRARLKAVRAAYNVTAKEFAEIINMPFRSYQNYESDRSEPIATRIAQISECTCVSVEWLTGKYPTPYFPEFVDFWENCLWHEQDGDIFLMSGDRRVYPYAAELKVLPEYADGSTRRKLYPLTVRAYILFLLRRYLLILKEGVFFTSDGTFLYHRVLQNDQSNIIRILTQLGLGLPQIPEYLQDDIYFRNVVKCSEHIRASLNAEVPQDLDCISRLSSRLDRKV